MVCLTRWDRTGCIVSSPIKFTEEPWLLNFVYRLALMSDNELGYDTTAKLATSAELKELKTIGLELKNSYARERAEEILDENNQIIYPIYKVTCPDIQGKECGEYFIGKHSAASYSPTGRATRGYITFIRKTSRLGFLKDYWRPNSDKIRTELDAYRRLRASGASNVATAIAGGDVAGQKTVTQRYLDDEIVPLEYAHCRLVFKELARPLSDYTDSSEMIVLIYHALEGHKDAWEKAKLLHRDISPDNIMKVVDQEVDVDDSINDILNDWDLCRHKDELDAEATQHGRSGTWGFMSAVSLQYPLKPYELADDLEAFIHVLICCCLRFHRHDMSHDSIDPSLGQKQLAENNRKNTKLCAYVSNYFHASWDDGAGVESGGAQKKLYIELGSPKFVLDDDVSPILVELVAELYQLLQAHYASIDFKKLKKYAVNRRIRPLPSQKQPRSSGIPKPRFSIKRVEEEDTVPKRMNSGHLALEVQGNNMLATHRYVLGAFRKAAIAIEEKGQDLPLDKTGDQFLELIELTDKAPPGSTGSRCL